MSVVESNGKPPFERRLAWLVAVTLVAGGALWVLLTDALLYAFVTDVSLIARIETAKGWVFVGLAAGLAYGTTHWIAQRMIRTRATLAAVVDSIADGVLLLGQDRRIKHANPAAEQMLRCRELAGMSADEFSRRFHVSYPDGTLVPPSQYVSQRVFDEGGPLRYKALLFPPAAPELVISVTAAAVRDKLDEEPHHVVSVMHDITASERMEQTRNEFFAAAAHALKTPLAIIKTCAENATADTSSTADSLATIERQCSRADRLVQNLLVLARTRTRTLQLRHETIDAKPVVERCLREMAIERAPRLVVRELACECYIRADRERFALLLHDLVDAACRSASRDSAIRVTLDRCNADAELRVEYEALPAEERQIDMTGTYDEVGIDKLVADAIATAHRWTLSEMHDGAKTSWFLRLPISSEPIYEHRKGYSDR